MIEGVAIKSLHMYLSDLMDSIRAGETNNWSLSAEELTTLASSLSEFFQRTGIVNSEQNQQKPLNNGNQVGIVIKKGKIE